MTFTTLLVIGLLCLIFRSTRFIGVVGLTLLSLIYPGALIGMIAIGCIFFYVRYRYNRSKLNEYQYTYLP